MVFCYGSGISIISNKDGYDHMIMWLVDHPCPSDSLAMIWGECFSIRRCNGEDAVNTKSGTTQVFWRSVGDFWLPLLIWKFSLRVLYGCNHFAVATILGPMRDSVRWPMMIGHQERTSSRKGVLKFV